MTHLFLSSLLLFVMGCSSQLTLSPYGCDFAHTSHDDGEAKQQVLYNEGHWIKDIGNDENIFLVKDLLKANDYRCEDIGLVSYEFKQGFVESVLSLAPFVHRERIIIRGKIKPITDDRFMDDN